MFYSLLVYLLWQIIINIVVGVVDAVAIVIRHLHHLHQHSTSLSAHTYQEIDMWHMLLGPIEWKMNLNEKKKTDLTVDFYWGKEDVYTIPIFVVYSLLNNNLKL